VFVLVALLCLLFYARLPGRLPSAADYGAVSERLKAEQRPGDVVLLFPWWTERARLYLPPEVPVVGYFGSDRDNLTAHPRIWVLGQPQLPGTGEEGFRKAFLPGRTTVGQPFQAGNLTLTLYTNGRYRPHRFVASEAYARARVYVESPDGTRRPCPFDGRAHRCQGPSHLYVAPEWHELYYEPRRCLWMHPPGGPDRLVVELDGVPSGMGLRLEGGITFENTFNRSHLSNIHMGVDDAKSGERLLDVVVPQGVPGVQKAERSLPPGEPRTVKIWSQATNPELRHLCLDVVALGAPGEGA